VFKKKKKKKDARSFLFTCLFTDRAAVNNPRPRPGLGSTSLRRMW
jgi:hypothetical protein